MFTQQSPENRGVNITVILFGQQDNRHFIKYGKYKYVNFHWCHEAAGNDTSQVYFFITKGKKISKHFIREDTKSWTTLWKYCYKYNRSPQRREASYRSTGQNQEQNQKDHQLKNVFKCDLINFNPFLWKYARKYSKNSWDQMFEMQVPAPFFRNWYANKFSLIQLS